MSDSLVKGLAKAEWKASRIEPGASLPAQGWLMRGVFAQVQEGNRLQRAIIGFGHGETDLQVVTILDDLSRGQPRPLFEVATDATSGHQIGAGPTLAFAPWGGAVHFVKAGSDLEKNVKKTASQIVAQIVQHTAKTE